MIELVAPHWFWLSLGVILAIAEIVVPGFFLIWLALAAILTGLITSLLDVGVPAQMGLFAISAVASVYAGRRWFALNPIASDDPALNDRGARLIGEIVTVVEPIGAGQGRVKVGDGVWSAKGPDTPVGGHVRISGANGSVLIVESVDGQT